MMLRAILKGLGRALKSVFGYGVGLLGILVALPFRILGGRPQPSRPEVDIKELKARVAGHGLTSSEITRSQMRDAQIAYSWIVGCTLDNRANLFPTALSKTMATWLQGLRYENLVLLRNAGPKGIFEHVTGKRLLDGVPRHRAMKPVMLHFPPAPKTDSTAPRLVRC